MEDQDIIQEFLIESGENLARLDQEMVELERQPGNRELLSSVFRTIHTIKGTCGFFGFSRLETLAHVTEDILSDLRNGRRNLDAALTTLILESVDAIKRILSSIEAEAGEGEPFEGDLLERLKQARDGKPPETQAAVSETMQTKSQPVSPPPEAARTAPSAEPVANSSDARTRPVAPAEPARNAPGEAGAPAGAHAAADSTLRVDVGLLDRLMNQVGELVLTRNQLVQYNTARDDSALNVISQRLNLITTELQEGVMKTRMQPIGVVWSKFPRMVRDLAASLAKEIGLEMDGSETELDRTIIEAIKDPLTHIVRNSCDHGIEAPSERLNRGKPAKGRLTLRAFHEGGQVNIEITDDGAGIDPERVKAKAVERGLISSDQARRISDREAINLVFLPGFSLAPAVTSISGRGVGMDVVRTHIERIGGAVDLVGQPGRGTTVRVRIPLTLAIVPGLVVSAGGERFVIPQINLHELIRLEGDAARSRIEYIHSTPVYRRRDMLLPLADLSRIFGLEPQRPADEISIVVLQADDHRFGLIVDAINDSQEIVVKPLGQQLKGLNCYAGATIMGDGRIALILDIPGIGLRSGVIAPAGQKTTTAVSPTASDASEGRRSSLLLFRAGGFARLAMALSQVARLEKIAVSQVEKAAGRPVVQYRDRVLPLIALAEALGGASEVQQDPLHVVVYKNGPSELGLIVDEITDIVEDTVTNSGGCDRPGLLGSAVVGGKVTDFLDLDTVARWASNSSSESLMKLEAVLSSENQRLSQEALP